MHGYEHDLQGYGEGTRGNGCASGDNCLYVIEWFASIGHTSELHTTVTALWCVKQPTLTKSASSQVVTSRGVE
jgi:hemolysin-activating ACP:hemolysin acyltransferase